MKIQNPAIFSIYHRNQVEPRGSQNKFRIDSIWTTNKDFSDFTNNKHYLDSCFSPVLDFIGASMAGLVFHIRATRLSLPRVHNKKEHLEKNKMFLQIYLYFFILFRQIN